MIPTILLFLILSTSAWAQILAPIFSNLNVSTGGGAPTLTFVQGSNSSSASANTTTVAMGSALGAGNLLVCVSEVEATSGPNTSVFSSSSGASLTWSSIGSAGQVSVTFSGQAAYALTGAGGAETVQVAWSGGGLSTGFTNIACAEYHTTNTWNSTALDKTTQTIKSTASTTCDSGATAATTVANEMVVGVCLTWNAAQTWGTVTGYTNRATPSRGTVGWYDKAISATGVQQYTNSAITSDIDMAFVATFKSN